MKKSILAIVMVFALLASFTACQKLETTDGSVPVVTMRPYMTDEEGNTVYAQVEKDEEGNVKFYVTNPDGSVNYVDEKDVVVETVDDETVEELLDMMQNPEQIIEPDAPAADLEIADGAIPEDNFDEIEVELDENGNPKHEGELSYKDIVAGGKFTIQATVQATSDGKTMNVPFTITKSGEKAYIEASVPIQEGGSVKAGLLTTENESYLVVPAMKSYIVVDDASMGDLFPLEDIQQEINDSETYSHSGKVDIGGKTYTCDVYEADGATVKYYYDEAGNIARIENFAGDDVVITEFKSISADVDDSKLTLPSYYFDLSVLESVDGAALSSAVAAEG